MVQKNAYLLTLSLPCLSHHQWEKTNKTAKYEIIKHAKGLPSKMHGIEGRFVTGPSNMLFVSLYQCTSQPGDFTGWAVKGLTHRHNTHK